MRYARMTPGVIDQKTQSSFGELAKGGSGGRFKSAKNLFFA